MRRALRAGVGMWAGLALSALAGCSATPEPGSSATPTAQTARGFSDVEVFSAFPARTQGEAPGRVCGSEGGADGVEFAVNLLSSTVGKTTCAADYDRSVHAGDAIDLQPVTLGGANPTLVAANFKAELTCLEPRKQGPATCSSGKLATTAATGLRYDARAPRCSKDDPKSHVDVALIVDHSGSTSGLVHDKTNLEEQLPQLGANVPYKGLDVMSDPYRMRVDAAINFIDLLNPDDKLITYSFDEKNGIQLACSPAFKCEGGSNSGKQCSEPGDKAACPDGACKGDPDESKPFDPIPGLPFKRAPSAGESQSLKCWGKVKDKAKWHKNGLDLWVRNAGEGRAMVWQAVSEAYTFLTGSQDDGNSGEPVNRAKHIVLLVDGPDTCTESEDFNWKNLAGKSTCRIPCSGATEQWKSLGEKMQQDAQAKNGGKPLVSVHVVQFQAPGYRNPDARLQELACRTEGTYQFVNTEEMPRDKVESYEPIRSAMARVRHALAGSWRVTVPLPQLAEAKVGAMLALDGALRLDNAKFPSLKTVYESGNQAWRFGFSGLSDSRLLMRKACGSAGDCGGQEECAANHCREGGLCVASSAPDRLPCGETATTRCCGGKCRPASDCTNCKL